jgi:exosortase A-associated hydrolase 1
MNAGQRALRFICEGSALVGIIDVPERPIQRGVLVVTGGPQYRVGSHRQFALMARALATSGVPVMRFDVRGMGDSEGEPRPFDDISADIGAAIEEFFRQIQELKEVVIWGLCDGATAAAFYAHTDQRVRGLVLLNPWVRTPEGAARATLRHYYLSRLGELEFWKKVASGNFQWGASASSLGNQLKLAAGDRDAALPQRMLASLGCFEGQVLVVLSGDDLTAREFCDLMANNELKARRVDIAHANHTFARREWRDEVSELSANWVMSW